MKILVLSMLRIGDLFMQEPLLRSLRARHPQSRIDIVVNSVCESAVSLLSDIVDDVHIFRRDEYQRSMGEAQFNLLWGVDQIDQFIDKLSQQNYDIVYNFTHNRLSAYLSGAIVCNERKGLHFSEGQFKGLNSAWMNYLNSSFSQKKGSVFHYTEVLGSAFELPVAQHKVKRSVRRSGLILFQCFTSEERKNWTVSQFFELKNEIESRFPFHIVKVIATEKEKEVLLGSFADADIWVTDLEMARTLLSEARLFVGVDTSIKHLAAIMKVPVVEIAVGGSETVKTGPFINQKSSMIGSVASEVQVSQVLEEVDKHLNDFNYTQEISNDLRCDRWVWAQHLGVSSLSSEDLIQPSPNASYIARSFRLLEWQLRLENLMTEKSDLYMKELITVDEVQDFIVLAQEITSSKMDLAGYFQKFIEVLMTSSNRGSELYLALSEAVTMSRSLLKIRSELAIGGLNESESREASHIST